MTNPITYWLSIEPCHGTDHSEPEQGQSVRNSESLWAFRDDRSKIMSGRKAPHTGISSPPKQLLSQLFPRL